MLANINISIAQFGPLRGPISSKTIIAIKVPRTQMLVSKYHSL